MPQSFLRRVAALAPLTTTTDLCPHTLPQFFWVTIKVSCTVRAWGDGQQLLISGRELWIDGMPPELGARGPACASHL